jgi:hypothetical protein
VSSLPQPSGVPTQEHAEDTEAESGHHLQSRPDEGPFAVSRAAPEVSALIGGFDVVSGGSADESGAPAVWWPARL